MLEPLIFISWLFGSLAAGFAGREREIGFVTALVCSIFASPVIGFLCVLSSQRTSDMQFKKAVYEKLKAMAPATAE